MWWLGRTRFGRPRPSDPVHKIVDRVADISIEPPVIVSSSEACSRTINHALGTTPGDRKGTNTDADIVTRIIGIVPAARARLHSAWVHPPGRLIPHISIDVQRPSSSDWIPLQESSRRRIVIAVSDMEEREFLTTPITSPFLYAPGTQTVIAPILAIA